MKTLIAAMVIGLPLLLVVTRPREAVREPELQIQETIGEEPKVTAKEFPYSVVRGGVHNADDACPDAEIAPQIVGD